MGETLITICLLSTLVLGGGALTVSLITLAITVKRLQPKIDLRVVIDPEAAREMVTNHKRTALRTTSEITDI